MKKLYFIDWDVNEQIAPCSGKKDLVIKYQKVICEFLGYGEILTWKIFKFMNQYIKEYRKGEVVRGFEEFTDTEMEEKIADVEAKIKGR